MELTMTNDLNTTIVASNPKDIQNFTDVRTATAPMIAGNYTYDLHYYQIMVAQVGYTNGYVIGGNNKVRSICYLC
jgi:hypothetical protein